MENLSSGLTRASLCHVSLSYHFLWSAFRFRIPSDACVFHHARIAGSAAVFGWWLRPRYHSGISFGCYCLCWASYYPLPVCGVVSLLQPLTIQAAHSSCRSCLLVRFSLGSMTGFQSRLFYGSLSYRQKRSALTCYPYRHCGYALFWLYFFSTEFQF